MSHQTDSHASPEVTRRQERLHRPTARTLRAPAGLLALVLALSMLAPASALAISRDAVLARGQVWVDSPVKYSQSKHHAGYRTDCSGFVSMCWKTGTSWSTRTFKRVTFRIPTSQLKPGDAMLKRGYHIRLFYGWLDDAHTEYVAYEASSGKVAPCRIHSIAEDLHAGYVPTRYRRITSSPTSANILHNGSFNTWSKGWGSAADQPVWWQVDGPWQQTLVAHRKDTYRSARNSLELRNPSDDAETYTELTESVPVVTGANYRLSTWARTAYDPAGLQLSLSYLNAAGESMAETSTSGDVAGIGGSAFKAMSMQLTSPADAVRAVVTVRLAGGTTTDATGNTATGTSAVLDDVSLVRP